LVRADVMHVDVIIAGRGELSKDGDVPVGIGAAQERLRDICLGHMSHRPDDRGGKRPIQSRRVEPGGPPSVMGDATRLTLITCPADADNGRTALIERPPCGGQRRTGASTGSGEPCRGLARPALRCEPRAVDAQWP
jgi:hypothetical protein